MGAGRSFSRNDFEACKICSAHSRSTLSASLLACVRVASYESLPSKTLKNIARAGSYRDGDLRSA